ncbi:MAG: glycoside hydrolase family 47 protein [Gammaproteobacteria bacterium]|nr:glycoside hydrolase family 47 protein [Gammaproteobacteria bacterium]
MRTYWAAVAMAIAIAACAISVPQRVIADPTAAGAKKVTGASSPVVVSDTEARRLAAQVKQEFLHAWTHYEHDAWGHDELRPLSRKPYDWYDESLLITPVDGLDTLIVMGLKEEADKARALIDSKLSFDKDIYVKNFEITIRLLGGLLSSYELSGDARLLALAQDLGNRLLPVFDSPTGLPYVFVNLHTGKVRGTQTNPAETGTLLLEFGALSKLTGKPVYYEKAKRALVETYGRRSALGLVGNAIDVETGKWLGKVSHIRGGVDSYYEYLWKCWKLFADRDCLDMWNHSIAAVNQYLADNPRGELWYGQADMDTGKRTHTHYGALDAFFPAVLAFSGDLDRARALQASSFKMWNLNGVEPGTLDYQAMKVTEASYGLGPEIIESTYYLYHLTGDPQYRLMGRGMWRDFKKYCRAKNGYASLKSVITKEQDDDMGTYLFAETFKYFYLLFSPPDTLDFDHIVLNTEAHPLRRDTPSVAAARDGAQAVPPFMLKTPDERTSISIDTSAAPELKDWAQTNLAPVLALWYPRIDALLASDGFVAPTRVMMTFKPEPGVAETEGTQVSGNSEWFRKHLDDEAIGAMVHELVHVVQQYGDREPESFPGWLTEGIADYVRFFKFEPDYHGADDVWLKKQDFAKIRFDGAYRQSANFLDWVTRKYDPQIVVKLNASARRGTYSEDIWKQKSGKTSAELGKEWKEEKAQLLKSLGSS